MWQTFRFSRRWYEHIVHSVIGVARAGIAAADTSIGLAFHPLAAEVVAHPRESRRNKYPCHHIVNDFGCVFAHVITRFPDSRKVWKVKPPAEVVVLMLFGP